MKTIILFMILPGVLCGMCGDCDFPYQQYMKSYHKHFEHTAEFYVGKVITEKHLKNDREKAIFYSGCAFSLEYILDLENKY